MKIETTISPRRDGTVTFEHAGKRVVLMPDASGRLVADVEDDDVIAHMLSYDHFLPADEADFAVAERLTVQKVVDEEENDDDEEDDEEFPSAPPVEAATPPSRRRPRKVK